MPKETRAAARRHSRRSPNGVRVENSEERPALVVGPALRWHVREASRRLKGVVYRPVNQDPRYRAHLERLWGMSYEDVLSELEHLVSPPPNPLKRSLPSSPIYYWFDWQPSASYAQRFRKTMAFYLDPRVERDPKLRALGRRGALVIKKLMLANRLRGRGRRLKEPGSKLAVNTDRELLSRIQSVFRACRRRHKRERGRSICRPCLGHVLQQECPRLSDAERDTRVRQLWNLQGLRPARVTARVAGWSVSGTAGADQEPTAPTVHE